MHWKTAISFLLVLILSLWVGQFGLAQEVKKSRCGDLWPVEQQGKYGYIDKTGKLVIPCKFGYAWDFCEGLAAVEIDGKYGYIDQTGQIVIPPQFYVALPFSEGLAIVVVREIEKGEVKSTRAGYIDRSGALVIQAQGVEDQRMLSRFSEGLAWVLRNDEFGFIDKTGRQVIPPQYTSAETFSEGLAVVSADGKKFGYIDQTGKVVIPLQFDLADSFSEGLAHIQAEGQHAYIDKSGRIVIRGKGAGYFSEGLAGVQGKNGKYGFIDKTGKFAIPPRFYRVGDFSEGLAPVVPVKFTGKDFKPGNLAYINKKGQIVIQGRSTIPDRPNGGERNLEYHAFCGGVARVGLAGKKGVIFDDEEGYINKAGKLIWPPSKKPLPKELP